MPKFNFRKPIIVQITFFSLFILSNALVLAESDFVQAAPGQFIEIELNLNTPETSFEIVPPESISGWLLKPQESSNIWQGTLIIKAKGPWKVLVTPDPVTVGHMSEYDSSNTRFVQGGNRLSNPLFVGAQGGNLVDLSKGGILIEGEGDMVVPITFKQKITENDPVLTDGHSYKIDLAYRLSAFGIIG